MDRSGHPHPSLPLRGGGNKGRGCQCTTLTSTG
jgi:hypothetical protein